jgi:hypothetical protein
LSRTRILAAAVALGALVLAAGALAPAANAVSSTPVVGQCRTTTFEQSFAESDTHAPVPCSTLHRMKTFAVGNIPAGMDYVHFNDDKLLGVAKALCTKKYWTALGGTFEQRDQTAYTWSWFIPTLAQRHAGARWLRCDLSLLYTVPGGNSAFAALPNFTFPMVGGHTVTDKTALCLSDTTHLYVTTCSRPHAARADQTFIIHTLEKPSASLVKSLATTNCPDKRYSTPHAYEWKHGDHVIVCYTKTTS